MNNEICDGKMTIAGINTFVVNETVVVKNGKTEFTIYDEHKQPLCNVILNDVFLTNNLPVVNSEAEKLTHLSDHHKLLLNLVNEDAEEEYTEKQMFYLIKLNQESSAKFDPIYWNGIIADLVFWKCFDLNGRVFTVDFVKIEQFLLTGRFQ